MADKAYPCDEPVPVEQEPRHRLVVSNRFIRAFAVEIAPHDQTLCHHHGHEYYLHVIGDSEFVSAVRDGAPMAQSLPDGHCGILPPGLVHVVHNLRDTRIRNLLVELMGGFAGLHRGRAPQVTSGHATITAHFREQRLVDFLLDLQKDATVEVCGPALVASPYDAPVELALPAEGRCTLSRFQHLFWLAPGSSATVTNLAGSPSRVVLIAVGEG